ncbi:hypothetical protein ACFL08_03875 [Patescibacteria group bacterium]
MSPLERAQKIVGRVNGIRRCVLAFGILVIVCSIMVMRFNYTLACYDLAVGGLIVISSLILAHLHAMAMLYVTRMELCNNYDNLLQKEIDNYSRLIAMEDKDLMLEVESADGFFEGDDIPIMGKNPREIRNSLIIINADNVKAQANLSVLKPSQHYNFCEKYFSWGMAK